MNGASDREGHRQAPKLSCPSRWVLAPLRRIADVALGKTPGKADYRASGDYKILKYRDLGDNGQIAWWNSDKGFVDAERAGLLNLRRLEPGDVLISASAHSSEIIGRKVLHVRQLPEVFKEIYFVGEILRIRVVDPALPDLARLLSYFFQSIHGYKTIQSKVHGVHLIASRAAEMVVPVPPVAAQKRIVSKIDELFSHIEVGERALERVQYLVERYRQSVIKAAVTGVLTRDWREKNRDKVESGEALLGRILRTRREAWENVELEKMKAKGVAPANDKWKRRYLEPSPPDTNDLPELPEGWTWASLEQIVAPERNSITDGPFGSNLKTEHYTDQGPRVIRLQNIKDGTFLDERTHISPAHFDRLRKHQVFAGDLLIAALGESLPRVCMVPQNLGPAIVKADCIRVKVSPYIVASCVMAFLNSPPSRQRTKKIIHGVGRPRLNLDEIRALTIPIPPTVEQRAIADQIEAQVSSMEHLLIEANQIARHARALRQSTLSNAFRSELVVQDPSDEPASALLERLTAERNMADASAKRGRPRKVAV